MKRVIMIALLLTQSVRAETPFTNSEIDLTVVGQIKFVCSIPRIGIGLIDCLKDDITINHIQTGWWPPELSDVPEPVAKIIQNTNKRPGNVAILSDFISHVKMTPSEYVPQESYIKIAYSMNESSSIPQRWVQILNNTFDLVVVPDEWLCEVYEKCGVKIPIFALPHGIYLENLLVKPVKTKASYPFTFGLSAGFWSRKNHMLLVDAFHKEFCKSPAVRLKLHGRMGELEEELQKKVNRLGATNIKINSGILAENDYEDFVKSLDCVVVLSKGEGFSIPPREALALGIPSIISDNTAHLMLSKTGYFRAVPSLIQEPVDSMYLDFYGESLGFMFNCSRDDVRKALRDVYTNYEQYLKKAQQGREWVKQYLWKNLRGKYLNLVKPKKVLLGDHNIVTNDYFMTKSEALFKKYSVIASNNNRNSRF